MSNLIPIVPSSPPPIDDGWEEDEFGDFLSADAADTTNIQLTETAKTVNECKNLSSTNQIYESEYNICTHAKAIPENVMHHDNNHINQTQNNDNALNNDQCPDVSKCSRNGENEEYSNNNTDLDVNQSSVHCDNNSNHSIDNGGACEVETIGSESTESATATKGFDNNDAISQGSLTDSGLYSSDVSPAPNSATSELEKHCSREQSLNLGDLSQRCDSDSSSNNTTSQSSVEKGGEYSRENTNSEEMESNDEHEESPEPLSFKPASFTEEEGGYFESEDLNCSITDFYESDYVHVNTSTDICANDLQEQAESEIGSTQVSNYVDSTSDIVFEEDSNCPQSSISQNNDLCDVHETESDQKAESDNFQSSAINIETRKNDGVENAKELALEISEEASKNLPVPPQEESEYDLEECVTDDDREKLSVNAEQSLSKAFSEDEDDTNTLGIAVDDGGEQVSDASGKQTVCVSEFEDVTTADDDASGKQTVCVSEFEDVTTDDDASGKETVCASEDVTTADDDGSGKQTVCASEFEDVTTADDDASGKQTVCASEDVAAEDDDASGKQTVCASEDVAAEDDDDFGGFATFEDTSDVKAAGDDGGWAAFGSETKDVDSDWAAFSQTTVEESNQENPADVKVLDQPDREFPAFSDDEETCEKDQPSSHSIKELDVNSALDSCFTWRSGPAEQHGGSITAESLLFIVSREDCVDQEIVSQPTGRIRQTKSVVKVDVNMWNHLKDMENAQGLKFQWTNSCASQMLLKAINIDTRNMLIGHKKQSVPIFASGLVPLLEPKASGMVMEASGTTVETILPSSAKLDGSSGEPSSGTIQDVPAVDFDWKDSGLTNPLDAQQKERAILQDLECSQVDQGSSSRRVVQPLENILANMKFTTTATLPPAAKEKLSLRANNVVSQLPDFSFMKARVLMFPVKREGAVAGGDNITTCDDQKISPLSNEDLKAATINEVQKTEVFEMF